MTPLMIVAWLVSAISLFTADNLMRGKAPIWAQNLLSAPVEPRWQEASFSLQEVLPVTTTVTETITVLPPGNTPLQAITIPPFSLPTWDFSCVSETARLAFRTMTSSFGSLVSGSRPLLSRYRALLSTIRAFPLPPAPDSATLVFALALAVLSCMGLFAYKTCLPGYASDEQLACLEAQIMKQDAYIEEMCHHHAGALRRSRRVLEDHEQMAAAVQHQSAKRSAEELSGCFMQIARLNFRVQEAESKAMVARYDAEELHQTTIDKLNSEVKKLKNSLDDKEKALDKAQQRLEEGRVESLETDLAAAKAEIVSLQGSQERLSTDLKAARDTNAALATKQEEQEAASAEAKKDMENEIWNSGDALKRNISRLEAEKSDLSSQLSDLRSELRSQLATKDQQITDLKVKLEDDQMKKLPTVFVAKPAGSKEEEMRERLKKASVSAPPTAAHDSTTTTPPVQIRRKVHPPNGLFWKPAPRPQAKK